MCSSDKFHHHMQSSHNNLCKNGLVQPPTPAGPVETLWPTQTDSGFVIVTRLIEVLATARGLVQCKQILFEYSSELDFANSVWSSC